MPTEDSPFDPILDISIKSWIGSDNQYINDRSRGLFDALENTLKIGFFVAYGISIVILGVAMQISLTTMWIVVFLIIVFGIWTLAAMQNFYRLTTHMKKVDELAVLIPEKMTFLEIKEIAPILQDCKSVLISSIRDRSLDVINALLRWQLRQYIDISIETLSKVTDDFCLDLSKRIHDISQELQSAKSELTQNLSWTPELLAVSEAQKLRLDRQIEQFEELKKRLVKM